MPIAPIHPPGTGAATAPGDGLMMAWSTSTRYYCAIVQLNLFGDWELLRIWGGRGSKRGGHEAQPVGDRETGLRLLRQQARRRSARGYVLGGADAEPGLSAPAAVGMPVELVKPRP